MELGSALSRDEMRRVRGGDACLEENIEPEQDKSCANTTCSSDSDCTKPSGNCICYGPNCGKKTGTC